MAETLYSPSSSGYAYDQKDLGTGSFSRSGWSTSESTIIQGGYAYGGDSVRYHYYGLMFLDFAAIRTKAQTHNLKSIRVRLTSKWSSDKTLYLHIGTGMSKDTFTASERPTDAGSTSVKTFNCPANGVGEITITDAAWLAAALDTGTTCFYVNRYATGNNSNDDTGNYWEGYGASDTAKPQFYLGWEPKGTVRYGTDGSWVECEVFYGTGGSWAKVAPYYGADGTWKPIGG